jgi:hypothetical protein
MDGKEDQEGVAKREAVFLKPVPKMWLDLGRKRAKKSSMV